MTAGKLWCPLPGGKEWLQENKSSGKQEETGH